MARLYKESTPEYLYHATDAKHLASILRYGIEPGHPARWSMTNTAQVYLASDHDIAFSYAEESDLDDEFPQEIAIFTIKTASLLSDKLFWDENIIGNHGESWQYTGTIFPFTITACTIKST